ALGRLPFAQPVALVVVAEDVEPTAVVLLQEGAVPAKVLGVAMAVEDRVLRLGMVQIERGDLRSVRRPQTDDVFPVAILRRGRLEDHAVRKEHREKEQSDIRAEEPPKHASYNSHSRDCTCIGCCPTFAISSASEAKMKKSERGSQTSGWVIH